MEHEAKIITVATYNIEFSMKPAMLTKTIYGIKAEGVNAICLQEVMKYPNREFIIDILLQTLGNNWKGEFFIGKELDVRGHGVAILWDSNKLHLQNVEKLLLPQLPKLTFSEQIVTLLFRIFHSPRQKERKAITCTFIYNQKPIRITSVHLDLVGSIIHREKQAKYILNFLKNHGNKPFEIICGDFNTVDMLKKGKEQKIMEELFTGYEFTDATKNIAWTADLYETDFKENLPYFTILFKKLNFHVRRKLDFIWFKGMEYLRSEKLELAGSDHFPIFAKLKL